MGVFPRCAVLLSVDYACGLATRRALGGSSLFFFLVCETTDLHGDMDVVHALDKLIQRCRSTGGVGLSVTTVFSTLPCRFS